MRDLRLACSAITVAALAASGANSAPNVFPGRNGRIVFASDRAIPGQPQADYRNGEIYSLDLASGRSRDLSRAADDERAPALSPDGAWIAFARSSPAGGGLWMMRRDGRARHRLAEVDVRADIGRQIITWSPDGARVAFSAVRPSGSSGLWVVNTDGSGLRRLTDFYVDTPRWSPGGTEIAFAGSVGVAPAHLGVIGADGTGLRWLTAPDNASDTEPAWSPDGTRIAFVRTTGLAACCPTENLFLIGADGSGERELTSYEAAVPIPLWSPSWSPRGGQIVFVRGGSTTDGEVNIVRSDVTGLRTIARHGSAPASWSPAGDRLAFGQLVRPSSGGSKVALVVERPGGAARRFHLESSSTSLVSGPFWSRSGKSLLYVSFSDSNDLELFSITALGQGLRQLTRNRLDDFDPAWSPDGRRIVFARGKIDTNANRVEHSALYLMDANGRHARRLTSGGPDTAPSWAPSGRRIVFARKDVVSILDLGTGRVHSLARGVDPAWSPDGRLIALAAGARLEAVRPGGSGARTLFDGGDEGQGITTEISRPSWSPDARAISFHLRYDHGRWSEDSNVIVSRTGETRGTLHCNPSSRPSFELESYDTGTAWSPNGEWVAADGVSVCRSDGSTGYWLSPGLEANWQRRTHR